MEIGDDKEEEEDEESYDGDNVLLLELETHAVEARGEIFDVERRGGGRGGGFTVVLLDEVPAVVLLVGGGIHVHCFYGGHGG